MIVTTKIGNSTSCLVLPDDSPTYSDLLARVGELEKELAEAKKEACDNWQVLESVCCGEGIPCVKCGKQRPCLCQDTGNHSK